MHKNKSHSSLHRGRVFKVFSFFLSFFGGSPSLSFSLLSATRWDHIVSFLGGSWSSSSTLLFKLLVVIDAQPPPPPSLCLYILPTVNTYTQTHTRLPFEIGVRRGRKDDGLQDNKLNKRHKYKPSRPSPPSVGRASERATDPVGSSSSLIYYSSRSSSDLRKKKWRLCFKIKF